MAQASARRESRGGSWELAGPLPLWPLPDSPGESSRVVLLRDDSGQQGRLKQVVSGFGQWILPVLRLRAGSLDGGEETPQHLP